MKSVASQCDSIGESLLSTNHFGFFKDAWWRPAAGGYPNRLWARTRTLVAAAAVAGLALLGPRMLNDAEVSAQNSPLLPPRTQALARSGSRARSLALSEGGAFHR